MAGFIKKNKVLIAFIVVVAARFININMPILEGTAMRQAQTAMIARNFYREGFNLLYPRADFFGNAPGYLVLEFPLMNALSAVGYILLGGVNELAGRLLCILFFTGAAYFLFRITKRLFDDNTAFWALIAFGFSPLSIIFSRVFMPDFEMLFFCLGALYFLIKSYDKEKYPDYWFSAIFLSLALLVKPHSFYILAPMAYLVWKKQNISFLADCKNWIYIIIAVVPAALWYAHGCNIHRYFTQEQALNYQLLNWFNPRQLFNKELYTNLIEIYSGILLTPIGLSLFIFGLMIKTKNEENILWPWIIGVIIFLIAFVTHISDPYYNLNVIPIASIFIGRAVNFMQGLDWRGTFLKSRWAKILLIALIIPFWLRYAAYAYVVPNGYRYIPEAGKRMQEISDKKDLIIAAPGVQALYFCDRKGWGFKLTDPHMDTKNKQDPITLLELLRKKGGKYFVSMVMSDFDNNIHFKEHMLKNYKIIEKKPKEYIIFYLGEN